MNYNESLEKLLSLTDLERVSGRGQHTRRYDLTRMRVLLDELGNPHLKTPTVHITGTKGKGSTAALISSVLSSQGYKPGLFTSPHLHTFRERIQFDGEPIARDEFSTLVEEIWPILTSINDDGSHGFITTFELLTAMAFLHFERKAAGFQIVEVGLGGSLDSTNLVQPQVCVFTSISLDHTAILGDTEEKIARDKSGIIKDGCVVVTSPQQTQVMNVIAQACQDHGAALVQSSEECTCTLSSTDLYGQNFDIVAPWGEFSLRTPLLGAHQLENATTALVTLQVLNELGFTVTRDSFARGFRSVQWPGRLEVLSEDPLLIIDGAHNPHSIGKLKDALYDYFQFRRVIYVLGFSSDKNISDMIQELPYANAEVIVTRSRHPRSAPVETLASEFSRLGVSVKQLDTVDEAIQYAMGFAQSDDLIAVTGSLFIVAEAREFLLNIPPELYPSLDAGMPIR